LESKLVTAIGELRSELREAAWWMEGQREDWEEAVRLSRLAIAGRLLGVNS